MRESFGGAFIINLLLVFVVVLVSFMALAISYSKAFRVKNQVINIIEQNQYTGSDDISTIDDIDKYLRSVAYYVENVSCEEKSTNGTVINGRLTNQGVCIIPMVEEQESNKYYKVITYIQVVFPFFGIDLVVPISGETKIIHVS